MANFLSSLATDLKGSSPASKVIAGLVAVATVAIVATFAVIAQRPHFRILFSGLDDAGSARVARALAEADIPFEISQPPGPFVIYADESDRIQAMQVVASSGALEHPPGGILAGESGMSTVFMSASERAQVVQKREWQEVERLLEGLDFVAAATVQTSAVHDSPFGKEVPRSGSVTLDVRGNRELSREQARTVADLVRFALRVEPDNLIISDQSGNAVHTGEDLDSLGGESDWLEQKLRYDTHMSEKASLLLADILGPGKARVTIDSTWDHDLSAQVSESSDPTQRVVISESSTSSKTPHFPPVTGGEIGGSTATGTASNIAIPGADESAGAPPEVAKATPPPEPVNAQTKQDKKDYYAPVQTTQTVRTTPLLRRLSIALFLDESMSAAAENLTASVKTAVGFDAARGDEISVTTIAFAAPEETAAETPADAPSPLFSPLVETLLRRGVEIASALVFLFVLFRGIKGARALAARPAPAEEAPSPAVVEMLARAKVAELIEKEPAKVGQILSDWARNEELVESAK